MDDLGRKTEGWGWRARSGVAERPEVGRLQGEGPGVKAVGTGRTAGAVNGEGDGRGGNSKGGRIMRLKIDSVAILIGRRVQR